jgi:acylphosphatase
MNGVRTVHVCIRGRVQGVGYRAWAEATAKAMGLTGWVRNRRDSSVELVLHGPRERVDEMFLKCKHGPSAARVTEVEMLGEDAGAHETFEVLPTA